MARRKFTCRPIAASTNAQPEDIEWNYPPESECYHISITVDPQVKWDRVHYEVPGGSRTLTVRYRKRTKDFAISETNPKYIYDDCTLRFKTKEDAQSFIDKYIELSPTEIAKVKKSQPRAIVPVSSSEFTAVPLYTSYTYIYRNARELLRNDNSNC